jgi:cell division protein FtsI (penicillin-binding protein 3)
VLDPTTGEVLALASAPAYDPNTFHRGDPALHRNVAIELPFEPGSVMKPLTAAALAENGAVGEFEEVFCEKGRWRRGRWSISDLHPHEWLTISQVIAKSSNIGMAKFAQRLSPAELHGPLAALGLGRRTRIDLPAENSGRLPDHRAWRGPDRDVIAFGHALTVTSLQLASAYGAIANGGIRIRPRVGRAWGSPQGTWHPTPAAESTQAISARAAKQVALWMLGVVEADGGTGRRAAVSGFRVAGKTGTAEKLTDGRYDPTRNIATFAGFAPAADPAVVIVISVDEPRGGARTGGVAAAPVFAEVMAETLRLLRVPPDYLPEPPEAPTGRVVDASPRARPTAAEVTAVTRRQERSPANVVTPPRKAGRPG